MQVKIWSHCYRHGARQSIQLLFFFFPFLLLFIQKNIRRLPRACHWVAPSTLRSVASFACRLRPGPGRWGAAAAQCLAAGHGGWRPVAGAPDTQREPVTADRSSAGGCQAHSKVAVMRLGQFMRRALRCI